MARLKPEFDKRNTKIIGLSVDPVDNHKRWSKDIEETQGYAVNYPMIGDPQLKVAKLYDMLPEGAGTTSEGRTAADNATVRSVFIIGPDKKIKAMLTYPMSSGRNFDEVLRLLDSCQLTAKHTVATPVNWKPGEDVIISASVSDEQAKAEVSRRLEDAEALSAHRPAAEVESGAPPALASDRLTLNQREARISRHSRAERSDQVASTDRSCRAGARAAMRWITAGRGSAQLQLLIGHDLQTAGHGRREFARAAAGNRDCSACRTAHCRARRSRRAAGRRARPRATMSGRIGRWR